MRWANILSREKLPMRRPYSFLVVAALFAMIFPALSRAQAPRDAEQVSRLITQLGSPRFPEREEAGRALDALGTVALEALRQAADDRDPEIARRATGLVRKIEKRQETARMLAPLRIRLLFADTPLAEAVDDLAKKTGFIIKLDGDKTLLADRTITLDTGEVTFWEAWERFCAAAGVAERSPAAPAANPAPQTYGTSVLIINGNMRVVSSDVTRPEAPEKEETLSLVHGKPRSLPTDRMGALRLSALPRETILVGQQKVDGEILFGLEASVEPRLKWLRALGLRVQRAIDDQDQALTPRLASLGKSAPPRGNPTMFVNGQPYYDDATPETNPRHIPVRLQRAEKPSHQLKELTGTLIALVQGPIEPLATIDNVFESAGKVVEGTGGTSLKVVEADRPENGEVHLRVYVESPPRGLDDGSFLPSTMVMVVNGRRIAGNDTEEPLSGQNFALMDQKGRRFPTLRAQTTGKRSGAAREYELSYQVEEGSEPTRFVFIGRRTAVVEVPFTLHDIPLP
jgi:hypothetical protein